MAGTVFADVANTVLKDFYIDGKIEPQVITETPLLSKIQGTDRGIVVDNVGGKQIVFPVRSGLTQGLGARAAGSALPLARKQLLDRCQFPVRKLSARVQIEGEAWRASEGAGKKSFISLIAEETAQALVAHARDMNVEAYGNNLGFRHRFTGPVASGAAVTISLDTTFTSGNPQWLFQDMLVDIWDGNSATANLVANAVALSAVDLVNATITIDELPVAIGAGTFYITRSGNMGNEMMGLTGMINDTSGLATFQGLSVSAKGYWRSTVLANGGTTRELTLTLMEQAYLASYQQDNTPPDLCFMDYTQHRKYEQLLVSDKRFRADNGRPVLDGGYERLVYNGIPVIPDVDNPGGTVFFLKKKYLYLFRQTGYTWMLSPDAKNIWKIVEGFDAYEAIAHWEGEFATKRRNAHSKIVDLNS